ncbi:hypothetical protein GHT06_021601 [Daphnia sinensis]|uniref:Uncharacterized protein n=1 Tax=Daphnia sinensis TaxID=1820382 RepID=A0AAD5KJZ8_9CRUS|nr:hypothetical protein GHT06_021601 [Daphnia sinensis]
MSSSFSSYANGLQPAERHAYLEKLKLISCAHCPYEIPKELWKQGNECNKFVPKITSSDIFIYLIETKCKEITGETAQAFKGLAYESKQAVRDGWIKSFICLVLHSGVVLVKAKVCPSQALGTTPHRPWAAIGKTGNVILANCTCAAG